MTWARFFKQGSDHAVAQTSTPPWTMGIRQSHRWLAILFTLTVLANLASAMRGRPPGWMTYCPLPPLSLLMFSGLYMFASPYFAEGRGARGS